MELLVPRNDKRGIVQNLEIERSLQTGGSLVRKPLAPLQTATVAASTGGGPAYATASPLETVGAELSMLFRKRW